MEMHYYLTCLSLYMLLGAKKNFKYIFQLGKDISIKHLIQ